MGHRANILSSSSKYFGLGLAYSASDTPYWTQVFANSQSESCSSVTPAPVSTPVSAPVTNPTASPTTAPVSTSSPVTDTNSPVSTPDTNSPVSTIPSTTPVTTPTAPVVAPSGCEMFIITLNTDSYGYETSFT